MACGHKTLHVADKSKFESRRSLASNNGSYLRRKTAGIAVGESLKELGYVNFPKPDVHLRDIFTELKLCPERVHDYQLFKAITRVAKNAHVTPYAADKLFWLIGSGNFYDDPAIGLVGSHKQDFIEFARSELYGDKMKI